MSLSEHRLIDYEEGAGQWVDLLLQLILTM